MATFNIGISGSFDRTGSTNFKVKYRLADGDGTWSSYLIPVPPTSGTTAVVHGLDNRIYNFQIQNLNGSDNKLSAIWSDCGITDPEPVLNPTANAVGYTFDNLSQDIDTYTVTLTTFEEPGIALGTHIIPAGAFPGTLSDTFTGLLPLTAYRLVICPAAASFTSCFVHVFSTTAEGLCPNVTGVTAALIS